MRVRIDFHSARARGRAGIVALSFRTLPGASPHAEERARAAGQPPPPPGPLLLSFICFSSLLCRHALALSLAEFLVCFRHPSIPTLAPHRLLPERRAELDVIRFHPLGLAARSPASSCFPWLEFPRLLWDKGAPCPTGGREGLR